MDYERHGNEQRASGPGGYQGVPDEAQAGAMRRLQGEVDALRAECALLRAGRAAPEEKYRTLFDSIDEAFCILGDFSFDAEGRCVDFRHLEVNPAYERETGLRGVQGRTYRELSGDGDPLLYEVVGRVALGGRPARFERWSAWLCGWYDMHVFRIEDRGAPQVGVLFTNVSERRRAEQALRQSRERKMFLLRFEDEMRALGAPAAVERQAARSLRSQLGADAVVLWELTADGMLAPATVDELAAQPQPHRRRFLAASGLRLWTQFHAGRSLTSENAGADARLGAACALGLAGSAGGWAALPLAREGMLVRLLTVEYAAPHIWSQHELALLHDAAARAWSALERAHAERALQASEEKYRSLFDAIDEGFAMVEVLFDAGDGAGGLRLLEVNRAFARQTGVPLAPGKRILEMLPGFDPKLLRSHALAALGSAPVRFDCQSAALDGRWFSVHLSRVGGAGSRQLAMVLDDISVRKHAELVLRDSERRQAFLLRLSDALRVAQSPADAIAMGARLLREHLGVQRVEVGEVGAGQVILHVGHGVALAPGAAWPDVGALDEALVIRDAAIDARLAPHQRQACLAQGTGALVRVAVAAEGVPTAVFVVHGAAARDWSDAEVDLVRDTAERTWTVTERIRAQALLAASERRYRTFTSLVPVLLWQTDAGGGQVYLNARWLEYTGQDAAQTQDGGWLRAIHPDDAAATGEVFRSAMAAGAPIEIEHRVRAADGVYRWFLVRQVPVRDAAGRLENWYGVAIDIDARRQAEAALQEADRRKDEFLAVLAHELRNPLAPISNAVQMLRRAGGQRKADRLMEMAHRQVRQITRLVDDLMDVSRITRGKIELARQPVPLAEVLAAAVETSRPAIDRASHAFSLRLPPEPLLLDADKVRLTQVFANLLNNAAKYTDAHGRIELAAWPEAGSGGEGGACGQVVVAVRDSGIGIPPEKLDQVFDMFTQVEAAGSHSQGGLGIGLAMVRSLVQMHGGSVEAKSGGPGKGSEFLVRLPLPALPAAGTGAAAPARAAAAPLAGRKVLVVDDNRDAADSLCMLLGSRGAHASCAYDGARALELLAALRPHSLVVDIGMPGMDGHQVAAAVRADPRFAGLQIIALTGWGQEADRRRSREAGIDHHLTKPVDLALLERLLVEAAI
ncbi:PAS domain S-box protein [Massilia forsythiae]|uniref:histidine kinase n=1 Tax=Massilia forsythiae TaxID=2728020 RepID=A0A7Z2ZUH9_9BURK|nr:ATP-binding protein [Massilia forsythiae]QJE02439.1 PAS domain S-box protein [Massilia forsythiae]